MTVNYGYLNQADVYSKCSLSPWYQHNGASCSERIHSCVDMLICITSVYTIHISTSTVSVSWCKIVVACQHAVVYIRVTARIYIQLLNWQLLNCIYNMAIIMKLCGTVM